MQSPPTHTSRLAKSTSIWGKCGGLTQSHALEGLTHSLILVIAKPISLSTTAKSTQRKKRELSNTRLFGDG
jgi:hypothetical protein